MKHFWRQSDVTVAVKSIDIIWSRHKKIHYRLCTQTDSNLICYVCLYKIYIYIYTGCPRRKGPNFGRVFLRSNYTDITQNTYIQSSMVTETLAREV